MIDIEYYTSEATTLLNSLIGIPSLSREEEAAADFLQNYIEETGIMTGRSGNNMETKNLPAKQKTKPGSE